MPSNYNWTVRSPNRLQPRIDATGQQQLKPTLKVPAPNAARLSAPNAARVSTPNAARVSAPNAGSPVGPQNAARDLYKPSVKPAAQHGMEVRKGYTGGVRYEPAKPVKDVVKGFEKM
jgi:hypothetical protein